VLLGRRLVEERLARHERPAMDVGLVDEIGHDVGVHRCDVTMLSGIVCQVEEERRIVFPPTFAFPVRAAGDEVRLVGSLSHRSSSLSE
jgi:hypothetical protein